MGSAFPKAVLGLPIALSLLSTLPASAEGVEEIIVTARRVEERLRDVPISITVFNQEQITNRNITNSADLALYTPSLSVSNILGTTTTSFSLRGFVQEIGTEPSVGVYFGDVVALRGASNQQPAGNGAGPGAFFDLQNVQVLKGPQGTLFGRNTTGGAVLLVPQKPTGQFEGYVEGSVGNYDLQRVQAVVNIPFGEAVRFRAGVDAMERSGYVKNLSNIGPDDFNDVGYVAARASLVVDVTPNVQNYTIARYTDSDTHGDLMRVLQANPGGATGALTAGQLARYANDGYFTTANNFPNANVKQEEWQLINTTSWRAGNDVTLKNIASYGELKVNLVNNFFGTQWDLADLNPLFPRPTAVDFQGSVSHPDGNTSRESTWTDELRLEGSALDSKLVWQSGVYYEQADPIGLSGSLAHNLVGCTDAKSLICAAPLPTANPAPGGGVIGGGSTTSTVGENWFRNSGVYVQGAYKLTDQLSLTLGTRYTWSKVRTTRTLKQYVYRQGFTPGQPLFFLCNVGTLATDCTESVRQESEAPTWLLGLDYKPTDDILLYGKWARGFRAGSVNPPGPPLLTFEPEEVDTYEFGMKTSFTGTIDGGLNFAVFYNDFRDQQIAINFDPLSPAIPSATGVVNAGQSTIYGLEVESTLLPFDDFSVDLSYAYLHTKVEEIDIPPIQSTIYVLNSPVQEGDELPFTPKHKLSITPAYTLPVPESLGRVTVSATYTYTDKQIAQYVRRDADGDPTDTSVLDSRNLLDVNLAWKDIAGSKVDVSLFANNITNEKYLNYVLDLRATGGFRAAQLGLPRLYGARLRYSF